jgi:hypothetical protein
MILIEPMMEEAPNKWSAKIPMSKPGPICDVNGAYKVQPPAGAPPGAKNEPNNKHAATGRIQKLSFYSLKGYPQTLRFLLLE